MCPAEKWDVVNTTKHTSGHCSEGMCNLAFWQGWTWERIKKKKRSTYHNWLTEILVHRCSPEGRKVNTVEGGLVPGVQQRPLRLEPLNHPRPSGEMFVLICKPVFPELRCVRRTSNGGEIPWMCRAVWFVSIVAIANRYYPLSPEWLKGSPEVCLGELLHVKLLICERGQVDVPDSREHFT